MIESDFKAKVKAAFKDSDIRLRLLACALGEPEEKLQALLAGELPEDEAGALMAKLEELVAPPASSPIPKTRARRAALRQLEGARKATEAASRSCRTGGGSAAYCERIEKSLEEIAGLRRELEEEEPSAPEEEPEPETDDSDDDQDAGE